MRTNVVLISSMAMAGVLMLGEGAWLDAKGRIARALLKAAWRRVPHGRSRQGRPARWNRAWPLASLAFPRHEQMLIVMEGGAGAASFGPQHVSGTAMPGELGNAVISAQHELDFTILSDVDIGDEMVLETRGGQTVSYRVRSIRTVREHDASILRPTEDRRLTLVTSYPPSARLAESDLRYAVVATSRTL